MRLSEAIREGCKYGRQIFGTRHGYGDGSSCALGAGENGVAGLALETSALFTQFHAEDIWPMLRTEQVNPVTKNFQHMNWVIADLNNDCLWSREAIAEWVETVERKLGLWDEVPKVETVKQETRTEYEVKPREYSFR